MNICSYVIVKSFMLFSDKDWIWTNQKLNNTNKEVSFTIV